MGREKTDCRPVHHGGERESRREKGERRRNEKRVEEEKVVERSRERESERGELPYLEA